MADKYSLSAAQTQLFLARFDEVNQDKPEKEIQKDFEESLGIEMESYKKRMGRIYAKFKKNKLNPEGCPELNYSGPNKFYKLRNWLQKQYGKPEELETEYPEGYVPLYSLFYVERHPVDWLCYKTVKEPGSLIKIKAPKCMGKTSLMRRILRKTEEEEYQNVYLDCSILESAVLTNLDKFERWLCIKIGKQLNLENKLKDYWDEELMTVNENCTAYFRDYILAEINCPLILGFDEVDRLFCYPEIAADFFAMLRSWHEEGKISETWQQLRIILAYATDIYIPLDLNQSPFNVGFPAELPEFNREQIESLAKVHQLDLNEQEITDFMAMVGGHPYLVRLGFYHLARGETRMKELLMNAPTEAGIYSDVLRRILATLETSPESLKAFKSIVISADAVALQPNLNRKLCALGLVKQEGNYLVPGCKLYREYFSTIFSL